MSVGCSRGDFFKTSQLWKKHKSTFSFKQNYSEVKLISKKLGSLPCHDVKDSQSYSMFQQVSLQVAFWKSKCLLNFTWNFSTCVIIIIAFIRCKVTYNTTSIFMFLKCLNLCLWCIFHLLETLVLSLRVKAWLSAPVSVFLLINKCALGSKLILT